MLNLKSLTCFILTLVMVSVSLASSALAFNGTPVMDMQNMDHAAMADMDMQDCPDHKGMTMTMEKNTCLIACYGLMASVEAESFTPFFQSTLINESPTVGIAASFAGQTIGVPTPPPNLA